MTNVIKFETGKVLLDEFLAELNTWADLTPHLTIKPEVLATIDPDLAAAGKPVRLTAAHVVALMDRKPRQ